MTPSEPMFLHVTHPEGNVGRITGFRYLWAHYVKGYDPDQHCQPCFIGSRVPEFCTPTATSGRRVVLDRIHRYPYVYICGVAAVPKGEKKLKNLHLPLRFEPGGVVEQTSYNGYHFRIENAARVEVPALPDDFAGKPREHARCKNFQFGVACFGYPPAKV